MNFSTLFIYLAFDGDFNPLFCLFTVLIILLIVSFLMLWARMAPDIKARKNVREEAERAKIEVQKQAEQDKVQAEKDEVVWNELLEKHQQLSKSQDYTLVKQFAKKYGNTNQNKESLLRLIGQLTNLQELLKNKEWDFSIDDLFQIVEWENEDQYRESVYKKILMNNPETRRGIIESYLNNFQSGDSKALEVLKFILERKELLENAWTLESEVKKIEKEFELKHFEKRLLEEEPQVYLSDIDQFNGYEFEDFLKNLFSKMGYQVEQTKLSGDQGADLVVVKLGEKSVIQAKRFGGKVGNKAVQEILAAISLYQAQKGMVVTNNYFTPAAVELANANNIELIDRNALEELINKHW